MADMEKEKLLSEAVLALSALAERSINKIDALTMFAEFMLMLAKEKETDKGLVEFMGRIEKLIEADRDEVERAYNVVGNIEKIARAIGGKNDATT
ncbi:hypothetical protein [Azospirillum lipoferum]|uniref:hypothetical protein n=1 Tax=Azospirillum lipoferum TaxID=193 RepID=UPI0005CA887A|nr:hypothetical protein [Azospirillum lipoferum]